MSKAIRLVTIFILVTTIEPTFSFAQSRHHFEIDSGYANVNGTRLYYEIAGVGATLVLIHGSFGDRRFWDPQFAELPKKYKVLRYDLRGYGKSALPDSNEVYRDAEDLNALLDFLKIKKVHICGLSLGSFVLFDFALAHPEKCLSLIPCGPRVAGDASGRYKSPNGDTLNAIISMASALVKNKGAKEATDYLWKGNHVMGKGIISSKTLQSLLKMGYEYSWWRYIHPGKREYIFPAAIERLKEISIPTLIVTSEYDFKLCQDVANILAKGIPGALLVSINGAGHIMNLDKPKEFNKSISHFLNNIQ